MIRSFAKPPKPEPPPAPTPKRKVWKKLVPQNRVNDDGNPLRSSPLFDEVYKRICEGWPLTEVARFIQEIKEEMTSLTREQLYQHLVALKSTIPPAELVRPTMSERHVEAVEVVQEGLDELVELQKLYQLQLGRINIDLENEKKISKLLPTMGQEVRIAREILHTYAQLKMDLGLSKRHIGEVEVEVNAKVAHDVAVRYNKPEVQSVLQDPQSLKKVLGVAERLMQMGASAADVIDIDPIEAEVVTVTTAPKDEE